MAEPVEKHETIEQARNAAIRWLEARGAVFGPHRRIQLGKFEDLAGKETGIESTHGPYFRLRLDYDPGKQAHFNAEIGKGSSRQKRAFAFQGGRELIQRLALKRSPR